MLLKPMAGYRFIKHKAPMIRPLQSDVCFGVRFKVRRCKVSANNERRKLTNKMLMGDEEMLRRLSCHPEIRDHIASLLCAVDDTGGDLKLADDAVMRLTQELQRMGQEAMQACADVEVIATEQEVRHSARAHRSGKKNSAGTPLLAT
jgi:hypothetical protein